MIGSIGRVWACAAPRQRQRVSGARRARRAWASCRWTCARSAATGSPARRASSCAGRAASASCTRPGAGPDPEWRFSFSFNSDPGGRRWSRRGPAVGRARSCACGCPGRGQPSPRGMRAGAAPARRRLAAAARASIIGVRLCAPRSVSLRPGPRRGARSMSLTPRRSRA